MLLIPAVFPPLNKTPQAQEYLLEGQANVVSFFYQFLSVCIRWPHNCFQFYSYFTMRQPGRQTVRAAEVLPSVSQFLKHKAMFFHAENLVLC